MEIGNVLKALIYFVMGLALNLMFFPILSSFIDDVALDDGLNLASKVALFCFMIAAMFVLPIMTAIGWDGAKE